MARLRQLVAAGAPVARALGRSHPAHAHRTLLHVSVLRRPSLDPARAARELECIELLLGVPGVDINARMGDPKTIPSYTNTRETPLLLACLYHAPGALLLLKHGARPDISDWSGYTARARLLEGDAHHNPGDTARLLAALDTALAEHVASGAGAEAQALREQGNAAFRAGNVDEATAKYSASLMRLDDGRTWANLAAVHLQRARDFARQIHRGPRMHVGLADVSKLEAIISRERAAWVECVTCSVRAAKMDPANPKAHYRHARGHLGGGCTTRALWAATEGLKACPGNPALAKLMADFRALGVPDQIPHPMSPAVQLVDSMVDQGCEIDQCPCCAEAIPLPWKQWNDKCPLSTGKLSANIYSDVNSLRLA